jgi:hypothetical protein
MRKWLRSIAFIILLPALMLGQDASDKPPPQIIKAVELRLANFKQYRHYSAQFFESCRAEISNVPLSIWPISGTLVPAKKDTGIVYRSQALIEAKYFDDFHYDQDVLLKREAGHLPIPNWHQLPGYGYGLLQERIYLNQTFDRGFISPLCEEGLKIYHYQILDSAFADGHKRYNISFKPKKEEYPGLKGNIWLIDSVFLPLETDFVISANNQLELLDSICLEQKYQWQKGEYKMLSQNVSLYINLFGYRGSYHIDHKFSQFEYSTLLRAEQFDALVYHQSKDDFNLDTNYWQSLASNQQHQNYYDSLSLKTPLAKQFRLYGRQRLEPENFVLYKNLYRHYTIRHNNWYTDLPAFYRSLGFNAVEGPYSRYVFKVGHIKDQQEWYLESQLRYGLADARLKPSFSLAHNSGHIKSRSFMLKGGTDYRQFNEDEPILPVLNTTYNLLLARNYLNLFGKDYLSFQYNSQPTPGFSFSSSLEYAYRYPLYNNTNFSLFKAQADFDANNDDFAENISTQGFRAHQALSFELNLSYQFKQLYEVRYKQRFQDLYDGRRNLQTRAPKLYFDLRAGIPTAFSETNYIFQRIGLQNSFRWGNIGLSQFDISAGSFLHSENLPFIDYQHFDGVQVFFLQPTTDRSAMIKQFSSLPYYNYSTNESFVELHFEHNFDGALLSQIDFIRPYKVHSLIGFNSLHLKDRRAFIELFFGLDNIFKVLRLEFVAGIDNFQSLRPAMRIGFDFNYDYYKRNR